ncbi:MAG: hypothetical protein DRP06_01565 [Candidatus Aenigmatarchaeota archaeon]|nr:MAG: hypothetical protein DRP06_01565 [Candidatus Aenigmarchaeota archaeon]
MMQFSKVYESSDINENGTFTRFYSPRLKDPKYLTNIYLESFAKRIILDAKNCLKNHDTVEEISRALAESRYPTTFSINAEDPEVKKMGEEAFLNYVGALENRLRNLPNDISSKLAIAGIAGGIPSGLGAYYGWKTSDPALATGADAALLAYLGLIVGSGKLGKVVSDYKSNKIEELLEITDKFKIHDSIQE